MPLSRYLKIFPSKDQNGWSLFYSTIKGSIIRVPSTFVEAAQNDSLGEAEITLLRRLEMYVDDLQAEQERLKNIVMRTNQRSGKFRGTVVMNLDCNLDCVYCFEKKFREGYYLSEETASMLVELVTRDHLDHGRNVELNFYGGEPLLSLPRLMRIAAEIGSNAQKRNLKFTFSMVTNGTLLNRETVEELLPLGFTSAQLTLDGPQEIHDQMRPFTSGSGSFDAIIANIADIYQLVNLKLGGNFSEDNYRAYPLMLDALLGAGVDPRQLDAIMFAPIRPESGRNTSIELAGHCLSSDEPWLNEAVVYLREETLKRGFSVMKTVMGSCMIEFEHDIVVNYDGTLYKCASFMGWPELSVGTLKDGIKDFSESHKLGIWKNDTCLECEYLPICFGGCRLLPLLRNGVIDEVDCRKPFYDATLERMILQDLNYKKG
ncbi:geopeptide radical SAM maturase [Geomesophilobacter sediminis]|uniref:Geopeptide radical SAM maturase n=1 Tax=Geomesophilobacter sediminis TaxID=2798584 RepID=A0A8J7J5Y9_9BACT|nr:geopeptide radical SAM maturase [Geomesophilobacter sediminis]MBJ6723986.1 geopeptide radical SAM maturase [Geomesophilobacter sediminis]